MLYSITEEEQRLVVLTEQVERADMYDEKIRERVINVIMQTRRKLLKKG